MRSEKARLPEPGFRFDAEPRRVVRLHIITGLLLTLGTTLLPLGELGRKYSGLGKLLGGEILWWIAVVVVLLYVAFVERRRFTSIGFVRPRLSDLVLAVIAGILMVAGIIVITQFVFPALRLTMNAGEMSKLMQTPFWYRFILVTRAAVAEELLFRGYPIPRLYELSGSRLFAGLLSIAAFAYAHLAGWGASQLIVAAYAGGVLTVLYLWRRNLWANMLAHWIADGAGFLIPHG